MANGRHWLQTVEDQGILKVDRFRDAAERIELTTLLDRVPGGDHADGKTDFISVLDDIWGVNGVSGNGTLDLALRVGASTARAYFETVIDRLPDDDSGPARELGQRHIPLIPALDYSGEQVGDTPSETSASAASDSTESIGRLVRAIDRASESKLERNRIVFREVSSETQRNIGPPPHPFEVYLVPYEESWSTALDTYADEWGTTQFERDTDIYQRVAAELGGYGEGTLPVDSVDDRPLEYLYSAYTQINRGRQDPSADLFVPIPYQGWHYHKRFTESADSAGIGNLLRGENFESISDDNYLFQLYIKRIEVPTSDGAWEPADQVAFGRDWAAKFSAAATHLDQADADDPFEGKRAGETGIADDFRRWAAAIDCAATIRDDATPELAPPAELRDLLGLSRSGSPDSDDAEGEDWVWTINFLLHLGLQVGPHIEWAWLNPVNTKQSSDRRPRALFLDEAKQLSDGSLPNTAGDALPVSPTRAELDRYADVCRRVHNHPAFVVNHAPDCQESAIQAYDEWSIKTASHGYRPVVIPLWWRFSNPPSDDTIETARSFRDAVLLLWPELSDRLFPTGWVCGGAFGNKHQVKSPRDRIPGLGVVQLRESPIWPVADTATDDQAEEQPAFLPAMSLVDGHRINALKQIDLDTIAETWQSEFEDAGDSLSFRSVIPEGDLKTWLAISISELSPAGAAERLDALLEEYTGNSAHPSDSWYGLVREEAFKLLRRFRPENAPDTVSDEDIARQWIRRDIYHTGTQLIVDEGNAADTIQVGAGSTADATVYDEALPGYATEQLQVRSERFVRLPTTNPGPIANVLADKTDGVDAVEFGIELRDVPIRPTVSGDIAGTRHQEMSEALGKRVADLAAAYAVEATGSKSSPGHVQRIEKRLHTAVEHVYSISSHEIDGDVGDVSSVKWVRESGDGIETEAFGIALLVGDAEPHHAVDALVDIVENEAVKDKFEVVLRADPGLERYRETRESFDLGDIERNELQRLLRSTLPALAAGVSRVLSNRNHSPVDYAFEVPDDDDTVEDYHGDLETFVRNGTYSDIVARYISDLTSGPLEEDQAVACLHASIYIAFERNNRAAVATLVDLLAGSVPDVAAGLTAVNEVVDELDLDNWGQFDANTLGEYLTAIALVEEFYSLLESHNDESDIRNHAATVRGKIDTLSPSPLDPIELVLPAAVRRTVDGDHSLPVVVFALLEDIENPPIRTDRSPENLHRQFSDWCADEHAEAEHLVGMSLAEWRLCDHFEDGDMAAVLPAVKAMLTPSEQSTRRENQRGRTNKQRDFDRGEVISEAQISPDSSGSDVEFPAVSTGSSHGDIKEEFTGADGRTGELFCIENAWEEFQTAGPAQPRIIKAVRDWRDGCHEPDQWRLQQTDDVFASVDAVSDLSGNFAFEKLRDRLCDADENWEERRKWFRMLVDVSEEKGPGFDYIDPFGGHYGSEYEASEWDPEWMRRVEVKSLSGRPDGGFKVTLTGNEFRMARRSCDLCNGRRYLVRLVFGRREGAQFHPTDLRDIDDILTEYGGSGADTAEVEARVWDALRGGSVPLRGSFE